MGLKAFLFSTIKILIIFFFFYALVDLVTQNKFLKPVRIGLERLDFIRIDFILIIHSNRITYLNPGNIKSGSIHNLFKLNFNPIWITGMSPKKIPITKILTQPR